MWLDNASDIDILFYEPYADVISEVALNPVYKPLTIGVFGIWGAGKSTLIKLVEKKIKEHAKEGKNICININAWSFEGYEDAKIAVMEALLRELHEVAPEGLKDKLKSLLKKIDFFKLFTKAVSTAAPVVASIATGNLPPIVLGLTGTAEDIGNGIKNASDALSKVQSDYLKDDKSSGSNESIVDNVRSFRREFEKTLKDEKIDNVVVLIDDLDRCQPDRIIDTLEAIKLFLAVNKMTFVIAADENVIQYAIRKKYPSIENYAVNLDKEYLEKIIQLPIYIPELSPKDIENYLMLLVAQKYISEIDFARVLNSIKTDGLLLSEDVIDAARIKSETEKYVASEDKDEFAETADVIAGIKAIVASNLKGNPRQAKRFLNTFVTKRKLAELYYTDEKLDYKVLAKLLVLQKLDNNLFVQLNEWNKSYDTVNGQYKKMREQITSDQGDKKIESDFSAWNTPIIQRWIETEPVDLEHKKLDRYFYLTRESLKKAEINVSLLSKAVQGILQRIGTAGTSGGLIDGIMKDVKNLSATDLDDLFGALLPKIESGEIPLAVTRSLFTDQEAYRDKIIAAFEKSNTKVNVPATPILIEMRNADAKRIDGLLDRLKEKGLITDSIFNIIKGKNKK